MSAPARVEDQTLTYKNQVTVDENITFSQSCVSLNSLLIIPAAGKPLLVYNEQKNLLCFAILIKKRNKDFIAN
jgi:hypothetical protein